VNLSRLFLASGTTDRPEGVRITHRMLAATALGHPRDVDPVAPEDAALDAPCLDHLARFNRPRATFGLAELRENKYGRVLKAALRRRLEGETE
jgi:hypothetical protein